MKRIILFNVLCILIIFLSQACNSIRKNSAAISPSLENTSYTLTFPEHILPIINTKCSPCHVTGKGSEEKYDQYDVAKEDIDKIIERIKRNPDQRGFMPKKRLPLNDTLIHLFEQWKAEGMH